MQSVEITNIDQYYDSDYDILVESEEEDQVYEVVRQGDQISNRTPGEYLARESRIAIRYKNPRLRMR